MKIYRVGGAVRDAILGQPVQDIDYVVTGATPEQMIKAGYTPVGKDFPVFLHPETGAEYALARSERKSAPGYHGFVFHCAPEVTLEQDLQRRDLTINAMAVADDTDETTIIDPFHGQRDLAAKVFRHVSDAFSEDPVRILRIARFAARFNEFSIAPETMQLMRAMVTTGEVDALVPERVWQEFSRGLMETRPSRMLQVLHECGALDRIMPELESARKLAQLLQVADYAAHEKQTLAVRWAALLTDATTGGEQARTLSARIKVPSDVRDVAIIAAREQRNIHAVRSMSAQACLQLLERCDAIRRPDRFGAIIRAVRCFYLLAESEFPQQAVLEKSLGAAMSIPAGQIAQAAAQRFPGQPHYIAEQILAARIAAVEQLNLLKTD